MKTTVRLKDNNSCDNFNLIEAKIRDLTNTLEWFELIRVLHMHYNCFSQDYDIKKVTFTLLYQIKWIDFMPITDNYAITAIPEKKRLYFKVDSVQLTEYKEVN